MISFVVEITCCIISQILIMNNQFGVLEPAALNCCTIVAISIISVVQLFTSPELRRFYLDPNYL